MGTLHKAINRTKRDSSAERTNDCTARCAIGGAEPVGRRISGD
jgi:hypothetical protein